MRSRTQNLYTTWVTILNMQRGERSRLEAIERQLKKSLSTVRSFLKSANAPIRMTRKQAQERATKICQELRGVRLAPGSKRLRELADQHGLPYQAVGTLFAAGYLKKTTKGTTLGPRGRRATKTRPVRETKAKGNTGSMRGTASIRRDKRPSRGIVT